MYALCESDRLISWGWVAYKTLFWIAEIDTVIDMSNSCTGVLYDFETSESYRGKGFYSVLLKYIMSDLIGIDVMYQYNMMIGHGFGWGVRDGGVDNISNVMASFRVNF